MSSSELTDEGKKRRGGFEEEDNEVFKRSRRIQRTPVKKEEDKTDKMMEILQQLAIDVKEIKKEQKTCMQELIELRKENEILKKENETFRKESDQTRKELRELSNIVDILEREKKKNNVVVTGLRIDTQDPEILKGTMKSMLTRALDVDIEIKSALKLGEKTCVIQLENETEKEKIMENKNKLKDFKEGTIYINHDLTVQEKKMQGEIRKMAVEAKEKGKSVKQGFRTITIDGKTWRWNRVERKLELIRN